jgi:hypothetical protein
LTECILKGESLKPGIPGEPEDISERAIPLISGFSVKSFSIKGIFLLNSVLLESLNGQKDLEDN